MIFASGAGFGRGALPVRGRGRLEPERRRGRRAARGRL